MAHLKNYKWITEVKDKERRAKREEQKVEQKKASLRWN
jgi:hypothetical protein